MKERENLPVKCHRAKEEISQKLKQTQTEYTLEVHKLVHGVDKCVSLRKDENKYFYHLAEQEQSYMEYESSISEWKHKNEQLVAAVQQYRDFESLNHENIKLLKKV